MMEDEYGKRTKALESKKDDETKVETHVRASVTGMTCVTKMKS